MLDLDFLVKQRADILGQNQKEWHTAVWSKDLQDLTSEMTDGEVESLILSCDSPDLLLATAGWLKDAMQTDSRSPFVILHETATASQKSISEWIRASLGSPGKRA